MESMKMKLHLNSTTPILTLVLVLTTLPTFSIDYSYLQQTECDPCEDTTISSNSNSKPMLSRVTKTSLFSTEEWTDIEIGSGIIQDRIKQKQETLSYLRDESINILDKMQCCQDDFGTVPYVKERNTKDEIPTGINIYCQYIENLLSVYISANQIVQLLINADRQEEKDQHQNSLYYLLSYEKKYFRDYIAQFYAHQIPEHSLEDTFYEMISSKLCSKDTKNFDILNEYLIFSVNPDGIRKQIDNKKLLDHYNSIHAELIKNFNKSHPIFWLGSVHADIKKLVEVQLKSIEDCLSQCGIKTVEATRIFSSKMDSYKETSSNHAQNIISFYTEFGPLILDTISQYEAVSTTIKEIERNSTEWLKNFKEKNKLFRKLSMKQREAVNDYLETQKAIEIKKRKEANLALQAKTEKKSRTRINTNKPKVENIELHPKDLISEKEDSREEKESISLSADPKMEKAEDKAEDDGSNTIEPPITVTKEPAVLSQNILHALLEPVTQPKVKVKTRPNPSVLVNSSIDVEATKEEALPLDLPEKLRTEEFKSFIKDLLAEKNKKKLMTLFKELNTVYEIPSESGEKDNKGYFAIRSPITNKIHVQTYHHLHVVENHYASIFMALKNVLRNANII